MFSFSIVKPGKMTGSLNQRFETVRNSIRAAEKAASRAPGSVRLLAVAKTRPAEDLVCLYSKGQRDFGESYLQEALEKQEHLAAYAIAWHFIGPIQSNKTRGIAEHFAWVHSVDRGKIAQRLNQHRPDYLAPLNICLQVNVSAEPSKSGVTLEDLPALITEVRKLPKLRLRGLMAIPARTQGFQEQRAAYRVMRENWDRLRDEGMDTLSIGMSGDMQAAIAEGATLVRIGTAIFGERD